MGFEQEKSDTLRTIVTCTATFSILGSSFVIFCYLKFPRLRTYTYKLIFSIAVNDFLSSSFYLLTFPASRNTTLCKIQGFGIQYFDTCSVMWSAATAFLLQRFTANIVGNGTHECEYFNSPIFMRRCILACQIFPLLPSIMPWFFDAFGPAHGICWIKKDNTAQWLRFFVYFLWAWIALFYIIGVYLFWMKAHFDNAGEQPRCLSDHRSIRWYALAMLVSQVWLLSDRIADFCTVGGSPYWLVCLARATGGSLGTFDGIIFGSNPDVQTELRKFIQGTVNASRLFSEDRTSIALGAHELDGGSISLQGESRREGWEGLHGGNANHHNPNGIGAAM